MSITSFTARTTAFLGLLLVGTSCQQGDLDVGQQIISPLELAIAPIDTFRVDAATVLTDTFATSADSSVLVGQWTDALTGRTSARGFSAVSYVSHDLPDRTGARFDSLVLVLPLGTAYGDTTTPTTLRVHRLTETVDTRTYYNLNAVGYEASSFLVKTVQPRPGSGSRQVRLKLPDAYGQSLFAALRSRTISDNETFHNLLKGFAFVAEPAPANLLLKLAISSGSAGLVLYYHENDLNQTRSTLRFPLQGGHFSQIVTSRSGTPLVALTDRRRSVTSSLTERTSFVIPAAMLQTRLSFPSIGQLALLETFRGLNRAELIVEPVGQNPRSNAAPPAQLVLFQTNSQNERLAIVPDGTGGSSTVGATYSYSLTDLEGQGQYVFDLTYYLNEILSTRLSNRPLLLTAVTSAAQLPQERLAIGDNSNGTYRMRLKLYATFGN